MARTTKWRNTTSLLAVAALALSACGGGDDDTDAVPAADDADEPASEPADEPADEPAAADDSADDREDASSDVVDTSSDESSGGGVTIRSIDDIPAVCRDELADFLRDIEPIVDGTDWATATLADMEAVGEEFQARATEFDDVSAAEGCNDLNFEDDNSFDLIIDYAQDEAPGTVGFLTFLNDFTTSMAGTVGGALGDDSSDGEDAGGSFDDCEGGIAYIEQLMSEYETLTEAPLNEIANLGDLAFVMMDCTPEQMQFFDTPEVDAFLGG